MTRTCSSRSLRSPALTWKSFRSECAVRRIIYVWCEFEFLSLHHHCVFKSRGTLNDTWGEMSSPVYGSPEIPAWLLVRERAPCSVNPSLLCIHPQVNPRQQPLPHLPNSCVPKSYQKHPLRSFPLLSQSQYNHAVIKEATHLAKFDLGRTPRIQGGDWRADGRTRREISHLLLVLILPLS